ncbi:MAG TPA: hypothetical protein PKG71_00615 [Candidatus Woesebacteria bacterium]|nr:hypothetical protein [Candidatus Woesebacteria bacterium]HNS94458.1 hypothetical protein [Candidatus Woesebacteria bacterium]
MITQALALETTLALHNTAPHIDRGITEILFSPAVSKLIHIIEGTFQLGNPAGSSQKGELGAMNILPEERLINSNPRAYKHSPDGEELVYGATYKFPVVYELELRPLNPSSHFPPNDRCTLRLAPQRNIQYERPSGAPLVELDGASKQEASIALSRMNGLHDPATIHQILETAECCNPYIEVAYTPNDNPGAIYRMELSEEGDIVCTLSLEVDPTIAPGENYQKRIIQVKKVIPFKKHSSSGTGKNYEQHFAALVNELLHCIRYKNGRDRVVK